MVRAGSRRNNDIGNLRMSPTSNRTTLLRSKGPMYHVRLFRDPNPEFSNSYLEG